MRVGPSQEEIRRRNLGALLRHVHLHGATSRAELTAALGLNRSTIGALTADLAAAGLVSEGAPRETGRAGRPSLVVRPESARVHAYALSIEVDVLRAARVGLGGVVLERRQVQRPADMPTEETLPLLAKLVKELRQPVTVEAGYVGTGLAVCGLLRRADGPVHGQPDTGWAGGPLTAALAAEFGADRPVLVGNAADVCVVAEHARGTGAGFDNVIYLHRDVGVDAGIIVGGRLLTGQGGYGGEVGHMVVRPGGRQCACGSRGCWETEIGEYALLGGDGRFGPDAPAGPGGTAGRAAALAVLEAAARGDAAARSALRQVGGWLGFGVANLVNIFNPGVVIFGGTLRDVYLATAAQVRSRLNSMALPAAREQVRLRTPQLGPDATLIGAAELAFGHLLTDPLAAS